MRFQDEEWETFGTSGFQFCGDAICEASRMAEKKWLCAMTRVVDDRRGTVVIVYAAGGGILK